MTFLTLEQAKKKVKQLQEKVSKKWELSPYTVKYGDKYFYTATYKTESGCELDYDLGNDYMSWVGDKNDPEIREIANKVEELWRINEEANNNDTRHIETRSE